MNKIAERSQKTLNKSRRRFLDLITRAGVSTSVLRASPIAAGMFLNRYAMAQSNKKLICIYHPNGSPDGNWAPGRSNALSPLSPHSDQCAFREMTISEPGNHGNIFLAAGANSYSPNDANSSSYSVQVSKVNPGILPSIELGVFTEGASNYINRRNGKDIPLYNDPAVAISKIFSAASQNTGSTTGTDTSVFDRRLSVLDANKSALDALRTKLGMEEKIKIDEHLTALAQLENKIQSEKSQAMGGGGGATGGSCAAPNLAGGGRTPLGDYRKQGDIAVAALKCGLTNSVSIQFNETQATWIPADGSPDAVDWREDHHKANHANGIDKLPDIHAYMNKGVAHIVNRLKQEGIFNDTVVVVFSEMGNGINHTVGDGPIIVASGIAGLQSGYKKDGASHIGVFNDLTQLLGLESALGGDIANYNGGGHVI